MEWADDNVEYHQPFIDDIKLLNLDELEDTFEQSKEAIKTLCKEIDQLEHQVAQNKHSLTVAKKRFTQLKRQLFHLVDYEKILNRSMAFDFQRIKENKMDQN
jgi:CII-binding regulator of phage lambda lysogenization HflD